MEDGALWMPNGRQLKLAHIRQWQEDLYQGAADLTRQWNGWRVRQQFLIAPGGSMQRGRISQHYLQHVIQAAEWQRRDTARRQLSLF
ncbi:MAG: hypothetical protein EPN56_14190 [Rhodanobacter sp.]|nr:MAG: hypothetical protein EPN78_08695 [Rhodanobacter sp.]TAM10054.1 MAG: hypothetical protein EPN66_10790 [Rhodanobacter sp.]TAM34750.1 MAG: hypothetical protein EPN56_14190 [Rhodanobacter sp.]